MSSSVKYMKYMNVSKSRRVRDILEFKFHETLPEDGLTNNGLCFNGVHLPEEVFFVILSYVNIDEILNCSLVCKKWCNIIKSHGFWARKYYRKYKKTARRLPWYVFYCLFSTNYFDVNLLKNGNGQEKLEHWVWDPKFFGSFEIEDPPLGTDPLPKNVPEFDGRTACFAISYGLGLKKYQEISFANNKLMIYVVSHFKPHIYLSEWVAGLFGSLTSYRLRCTMYTDEKPGDRRRYKFNPLRLVIVNRKLGQKQLDLDVEGGKWQQVKIVIKDYEQGMVRIMFQHGGYHFGRISQSCKVAGGVLKFLFDTINERPM